MGHALKGYTPNSTPWRDREFLTIQHASEVLGISAAAFYRFGNEGVLELKRVAGRTVVPVSALIRIVESAEIWTPSRRGAAARKALAKHREETRR